MDSLWHFAGDKSTDVNWYTKRISLLAIYKSTEVAMMQVNHPTKPFQSQLF
jgi:ubiquinone biosynthesis protein COQ9